MYRYMYIYIHVKVIIYICMFTYVPTPKGLQSWLVYYATIVLLMIEILSITLRTLNHGNSGLFLIMGNAGFISSTVSPKDPSGCIKVMIALWSEPKCSSRQRRFVGL